MPLSSEVAPSDPKHIADPQHWLDRAEEALAKAATMHDPHAKFMMTNVAQTYLKLAKWATERQIEGKK